MTYLDLEICQHPKLKAEMASRGFSELVNRLLWQYVNLETADVEDLHKALKLIETAKQQKKEAEAIASGN